MRMAKREPKRKNNARKIAPESPEAHDEGPRLLPLPDQRKDRLEWGQRALELADIALGHKRPAGKR